ncbi:PIN domain-containing protein [Haoranjiania flava]|uniref:hypothetical protein n=1 Tax=Haoranjiania flava TaxID=1856322 RepID=UPI0036D26150
MITGLTPEIKNIAIELRQNQILNTPEAIIAARAKFLQLQVVTPDKGFDKIKDVKIILI